MVMLGFWTGIILRLARMVLDAIRRDIGDASLKGEVPGTFYALVGALAGALFMGFIGMVAGGIIGAVLKGIFNSREAVRPI